MCLRCRLNYYVVAIWRGLAASLRERAAHVSRRAEELEAESAKRHAEAA